MKNNDNKKTKSFSRSDDEDNDFSAIDNIGKGFAIGDDKWHDFDTKVIGKTNEDTNDDDYEEEEFVETIIQEDQGIVVTDDAPVKISPVFSFARVSLATLERFEEMIRKEKNKIINEQRRAEEEIRKKALEEECKLKPSLISPCIGTTTTAICGQTKNNFTFDPRKYVYDPRANVSLNKSAHGCKNNNIKPNALRNKERKEKEAMEEKPAVVVDLEVEEEITMTVEQLEKVRTKIEMDMEYLVFENMLLLEEAQLVDYIGQHGGVCLNEYRLQLSENKAMINGLKKKLEKLDEKIKEQSTPAPVPTPVVSPTPTFTPTPAPVVVEQTLSQQIVNSFFTKESEVSKRTRAFEKISSGKSYSEKTIMCRYNCKLPQCKYAHNTEELCPMECAFGESCKVKHTNKCPRLHPGETKEQLLIRLGFKTAEEKKVYEIKSTGTKITNFWKSHKKDVGFWINKTINFWMKKNEQQGIKLVIIVTPTPAPKTTPTPVKPAPVKPTKTQICKFFLEKKCSRGCKCTFAHSHEELVQPNMCKFGDRCKFKLTTGARTCCFIHPNETKEQFWNRHR